MNCIDKYCEIVPQNIKMHT